MGYLVRRGSLGDWVAIYHDGVKLAEGHRLSPEDVFDLLEVRFDRDYVEQDDIGNGPGGSDPFPDTLP